MPRGHRAKARKQQRKANRAMRNGNFGKAMMHQNKANNQRWKANHGGPKVVVRGGPRVVVRQPPVIVQQQPMAVQQPMMMPAAPMMGGQQLFQQAMAPQQAMVPAGNVSGMASAAPTIFYLKEKMLSLNGSMYVYNAMSQPVYKIQGHVRLAGFNLDIQDYSSGRKLANLKKGLQLFQADRFDISVGGRVVANVREQNFKGSKYTISMADGTQLWLEGNVRRHNFRIHHPMLGVVCHIREERGTINDTYQVSIAAGQDIIIMLGAAVVLDKLHQ